MKRLLAMLLLGALTLPSVAEELQHSAPLINAYDVASTSYIYTSYLGQNGSQYGAPIAGAGNIKTTGSSTTVVSNTASAAALLPLSVGDLVLFTLPANAGLGTKTAVNVTAKASNDSMTVSTAVDLTGGVSYTYLRASRGTGATIGWLNVAGDAKKTFSWTIATINATSIEVQIQCIDDYLNAPAITVYPPVPSQTDTCYTGSFTAAKTCKFVMYEPYAACRFGLKVTTDGGAQSVTAGYLGAK